MPGESPLARDRPLPAGAAIPSADTSRVVADCRAGLAARCRLLVGGHAALLRPCAHPAGDGADDRALRPVSTVEVMQLAVFVGVMGAALLSAICLDPRTGPHRRRERRAAQPDRRSQRRAAALRSAAQSARPARHRLGERPQEAGTDRHAARRSRRARRRGRVPCLRPLADAALGRRARSRRRRACAKRPSRFDLIVEATNGAPLEVQGRKTAQHVIVRFLSLSETQRAQARLKLENQRLLGRP